MREIKYIGYYDTAENKVENRYYELSAANKMNYIISAINEAGFKIRVISMSGTRNNRGYKGKIINIGNGNLLKLFRTLRVGNRVRGIISRLSMLLFMFLYLITKVKKNETIIVYHSLIYTSMISLAKKIKKFRLILETEEIYADVINCEKARIKEYKLFSQADAFLFPTELLNAKLNNNGKPYAVVSGNYRAEKDRVHKFDDGRIHAVYAGTFDPRKGGAAAAAAAAEHLTDHYHVHILGFGNEDDKKYLLEKIDEISSKTKCKLTFDGLLSGEEYIQFIQSCDVGLSTQNPNAEFNDTSFPSKVLSYMANGLRVVSIKIKVLEISEFGNQLFFYEKDTAEDIANTIKSIDFSLPYDGRKILERLNKEFVNKLRVLLKNML